MKRYIAGIITGIIIAETITAFGASEQNITAVFDKIKLYVDGKQIKEQTLLYNGTTYIPLRAAAEALGKEVYYNAETYTAYIGNNKLEDIILPKKEIQLKGTGREFNGEIEFTGIEQKELYIYNSYNYEISFKLKGILKQEVGDTLNIIINCYDENNKLIQHSMIISRGVEKDKEIEIVDKFTVEKETKRIEIEKW